MAQNTRSFIGSPESHSRSHKFWFIVNDEGKKVHLPLILLTKYGLSSKDLSQKSTLELLVKDGRNGVYIYKIIKLDNKELRKMKSQLPEMKPDQIGEGVIKYLNEKEGWGFIQVLDHSDIFFHVYSCRRIFKRLRAGMAVQFLVLDTDRGQRAKWVRRCS